MDSVYNSPPNWPTPPAGWRPPSDWTPDQSWPAPPQDWQFWVEAPTPPPARSKRRLWLKIGVPIAVVAVIIVGGATALVVSADSELVPPQDVAKSYTQALKDHRYDAAFAMRCQDGAGDRGAYVEDWTSRTAEGGGISEFKLVGTKMETLNGQTVANVDFEVKYADGSKKDALVVLTKTDEVWHPCD